MPGFKYTASIYNLQVSSRQDATYNINNDSPDETTQANALMLSAGIMPAYRLSSHNAVPRLPL
jgi:hypothetical protein